MAETVRSYACGCDFGEGFTHLCKIADELEAAEHNAQNLLSSALTSAQHLIDDANRDEWAEVIGIDTSDEMRDAAKHLRVHAAELEIQANRYERALADSARYQREFSAHIARHTYRDVQIEAPPEVD